MAAESGEGGTGAANSLSVFGRVRAHAGSLFFSLALSHSPASLHNVSSFAKILIIIIRRHSYPTCSMQTVKAAMHPAEIQLITSVFLLICLATHAPHFLFTQSIDVYESYDFYS